MCEANLITSYLFQGQEFLIKMNAVGSFLEISVTDKQSGEEWQCSYDHAYIENLTHKTGNFKQFDIFATMLKSGLLKTSDCISLDLLTFEDLEALRIRRLKSHCSRTILNKQNNNRRYLILIYNVEFDRILYPLPLEYCGPPDPAILQGTIRKLEFELGRTRDELENRGGERNKCAKQILSMQKNIDDLVAENISLNGEIRHLTKIKTSNKSREQIRTLQNAIIHLEQSVLSERHSHHRLVEKLRQNKVQLLKDIEKYKEKERILKERLESEMARNNKDRFIQSISPRSFGDSKWRGDGFKTFYRRDDFNIYKTTAPAAAPPPPPLPFNRNNIRTRSLSPRLSPRRLSPRPMTIKSEAWGPPNIDNFTRAKRRRNAQAGRPAKPPRSRASSLASSCKNSDDGRMMLEYNNDIGVVRSTSNSKERVSRRQSSLARSPPSAPASGGSLTSNDSHASSHQSRSTQILKMKIKTSEDEFKNLEGRINALQKMLNNNIKL